MARELRQKLAADQIAAKNKEKIYANPTPLVHAARQWKTHDASVVDYNDNDCQRPKEIEIGLAVPIPEPRIEISFKWCCLFARHTENRK